MFRVVAFLVVFCATAHAIGISPNVDLPGVVNPRRALGTDVLDSDKVQAVLQVKVKSARPDNSDTKVNAVVCLNSDTGKCGKKQEPAVRPSIVMDDFDEDDDEEEITVQNKQTNIQDEEEEDERENDEENKKAEDNKQRRKQVIVIVDDDPSPEEKKKSKRKKVGDIPVVVGYGGMGNEEETKYINDIHIPGGNHYNSHQVIEDVPVFTGLKLSPEFDKSQQTYSYINPPPKDDIPVSFRQIPAYGFDETALVAHIFETSPLIKALQEKYISSFKPTGIRRVAGIPPRVAVSDIPDYIAGVERPYHHQPIPGFYGGHQPRVYSHHRGVVRPGGGGCYYPTPGLVGPTAGLVPSHVDGKVSFTGDEEDISHSSKTPTNVDDSAETSESPTVIKVDGKLGEQLENAKT